MLNHARRRIGKSYIVSRIASAAARLDTSLAPSKTIYRIRSYPFSWRSDGHYVFLACLALLNLCYIEFPSGPVRLGILILFITGVLIPATCQFIVPASPIFSWLLFYYASRFIPTQMRPHIWVSVLPTLESCLYGANISDILTRVTHPILDILAWLPYGLGHFISPFIVSSVIFVFAPPGSVKFFARAFGYMNLLGVTIQILFPCAPPWYELREGLTPAHYGMPGSPGGLARIDAILGTSMYTHAFSEAPLIFGAFPSLHAGCITMQALFLSHFFPQYRMAYWAYVGVLYWSTMYLSHHYLIDLVAGGGLAICSFYFFLGSDNSMRHLPLNFRTSSPTTLNNSSNSNNNNPEYNVDLEHGLQKFAAASSPMSPTSSSTSSAQHCREEVKSESYLAHPHHPYQPHHPNPVHVSAFSQHQSPPLPASTTTSQSSSPPPLPTSTATSSPPSPPMHLSSMNSPISRPRTPRSNTPL